MKYFLMADRALANIMAAPSLVLDEEESVVVKSALKSIKPILTYIKECLVPTDDEIEKLNVDQKIEVGLALAGDTLPKLQANVATTFVTDVALSCLSLCVNCHDMLSGDDIKKLSRAAEVMIDILSDKALAEIDNFDDDELIAKFRDTISDISENKVLLCEGAMSYAEHK